MERNLVYFAADVHLGLRLYDPAEREQRFVRFLKNLPRDRTKALYLLGDIWDFWYEYRDVVPREGARVVAELLSLLDAGIEVSFMEGNHDMWCYSFFESLGIRRLTQPVFVTLGGKQFCLGHGDGLGRSGFSERLLQRIFHSRICRALFSALHPTPAFLFARAWSAGNRKSRPAYHFQGEREPLYRFARQVAAGRKVDYFVFGHYHDAVRTQLPEGAEFLILPDWMRGGEPYACFDTETATFSPHFEVRPF